VLREVARGATNTRIGHTLGLSEVTVMPHLQNIMAKLHLANRGEAAAYAWKSGLQRPME
jgi:DNA-binding NarL/FixJ family response regulator